MNSNDIVDGLSRRDAYPRAVDGDVEVLQTHISVVFLAGEFAYKIKKPIKTDFLDYSTLERRQHHCSEELRLDFRYGGQIASSSNTCQFSPPALTPVLFANATVIYNCKTSCTGVIN